MVTWLPEGTLHVDDSSLLELSMVELSKVMVAYALPRSVLCTIAEGHTSPGAWLSSTTMVKPQVALLPDASSAVHDSCTRHPS